MMSIEFSKSLSEQMTELELVLTLLKSLTHLNEKISYLDQLSQVKKFLDLNPQFESFLSKLELSQQYAAKSILAIYQAPIVFNFHTAKNDLNKLLKLVHYLVHLEDFYKEIGGIIGYHFTIITLIHRQKSIHPIESKDKLYLHPEGLNIDSDKPEVHKAIREGIESLPQMVEMYPVGGAGDRLNLKDEQTDWPLPMALLPFSGHSLLEGLIQDLQAREYLYFKLFNKQMTIPIAMMTSDEKNNHTLILSLCQSKHWFGRPEDSYSFFKQPSVPVITIDGNWSLTTPLELKLKPCGHGVIWKLAKKAGIFEKYFKQNRHYATVRQINNPLGGTDHNLLALTGIGCGQRKAFGFVSCERFLNCEEGTNVLIQTQQKETVSYCLTNIEYTDFAQKGIGEIPAEPGSLFSLFPTNTNILFAHLPSVCEAVEVSPIPGQLINMKSKVSFINEEGQQSFVFGGRLESTMQNIADVFVDNFSHQLNETELKQKLKTFIIYNNRLKTISSTKKAYIKGEPSLSTPEQSFHDLLLNHYHLLQQCQVSLPKWRNFDDMLSNGPSCLFTFHPALGPLYTVILQKIRHGIFHLGAELQLDIAEVDIENLNLKGSLLIQSESVLGTRNQDKIIQYGNESRCVLKNVTIDNQGIDFSFPQIYWKNQLKRHEAVQIRLGEGAEFHAENIHLIGNQFFDVPAYHCLKLTGEEKNWKATLTSISHPSWQWNYHFDEQDKIHLTRQNFSTN